MFFNPVTFFFLLALIGKLISSGIEQPDSASSLDASKYAIGPKRKNKFSMKDSNVSGNKEVNKQNSTDQSIILESYLQRGGRESTISEPVEPADDIVELRSSASQDVSEESDVNPPKLSNDPDYDPINEPSLSSFKIGKQRAKAPRRMKGPETGITEAEQNAAASLLQLLLHNREHKTKEQQNGKQKQEAKTDNESNSNLPLKPRKPRLKRQRQHKPKFQSELRAAEQGVVASGSWQKRKFQSSPGLEESLQMSLAKLCAAKAETTTVEDLCATKCSFTSDRPNTDPPDLSPPPPMLPRPAPSGLDLECLSLVDLRAVAKEYHMRGYSMLKKAELIEELGLKLAIHGCYPTSHHLNQNMNSSKFAEYSCWTLGSMGYAVMSSWTAPQNNLGSPGEAREEGFPDALASVVGTHDIQKLELLGGVEGVATKVNVSLNEGVKSEDIPDRQKIYGSNKYTEKPSRSFWMFVWDALHDITLIILIVCAAVSIVSDYKQSLQFKDLDKEKKKIMIQVTRDGYRQKVPIYDLVVGDVVHLSIGDQVPADGVFISGYSLVIDESSLSGESEPINVYKGKPFLLAGTKVQDGSGKMLVTAVGMKTEWGKLMETLSEAGEDETPLQVKLNGVATLIGKIGLGFAVVTFLVLTVRFLVEKKLHNDFTHWSSSDALELLDYFAIAVTIIVVAVPEGLPLAVTLSLAFAMQKLMNEKALVRHLAAYLSEKALTVLLQAIFQNTSSELVKDKDGKNTILGTPTESAILEYGLLLGGDYNAQRRECKILKVEPFNSVKKKMSVLVALPDGGLRAFCKGASEIVLGMCNKIVDSDGEPVHMSEKQARDITDVINSFACEALRTLCLAFKDMDDAFNGNNIPDGGYTLIAVVGIKDPVRPGVKKAVQTCLAAGITVRMVTGDNINTAKAIAKECGILTDGGLAIEGPDFRNKSPEELKDIIPRIQVMARSLPLDKHKLVSNLRSMFHEVVAVTGDGTNDAPALKESDIGLAMGIAGTELLWVNLIMDTLGALALATEPPNDGLMKRPPVGRGVSFITKAMWKNIIGQSIYQLVVLGVLDFDGKNLLRLEGSDATKVLNTFIFNTFVFCQVFNEINSRDIEKINVFRGMFSSWIFIAVMVSTVAFQVVIVEFLGTFASTVPLSWQFWLLSILIGAVSMPISVVLKCIPVGKGTPTPKHHDGL
ncbi:autoinhibited Ca(2+)-ATPase, isoform 4 [Actinidia rufa]|uniref:P-type Cu(+) transporter n=1 Tax=Actinidia rufa TaxID=165716 RepID=A0A7J0FHM7_9ERIC|nr:autoinhibited Ca(2+)-ATPase, isoform 4 [Actinidia rufa]